MKKTLLLLLIAGLMLTLVVSCGKDDDDSATDPIIKQDGELTDLEFLTAEDAFAGAALYTDSLLFWMDLVLDTVLEDSASLASSAKVLGTEGDSGEIVYHEDSEYWYLYYQTIDTNHQGQAGLEIYTGVIRDSVQFLHGDTPVKWPIEDLLTGISNGVLLTWTMTNDSGSLTANAAQNVNVTGEIATRGLVTINGTRSFDLDLAGQNQNCAATLDVTGTATEIEGMLAVMDAGGCPTSGTLAHVGTIGIECTGDTSFALSDTWTRTETFEGDSSYVVIENSTTRWTFWHYCEHTGPVTKPFAMLRELIESR
ncbi:MAG: hypothetical protein JSU74_13475 [Candidatus Zixiibacteriota bacterium]|nr:MAG: hypothetical protein JSU74_13475 [candidate division Zixibacteria bacterium]